MHYVWLHTHIQKCVFTLTPSLLSHCLSVVVWRENKKFMRLFILEDKAWTADKRQTETYTGRKQKKEKGRGKNVDSHCH